MGIFIECDWFNLVLMCCWIEAFHLSFIKVRVMWIRWLQYAVYIQSFRGRKIYPVLNTHSQTGWPRQTQQKNWRHTIKPINPSTLIGSDGLTECVFVLNSGIKLQNIMIFYGSTFVSLPLHNSGDKWEINVMLDHLGHQAIY